MKKETCPVCDWEINDHGREIKVRDRTVIVCCEECEKELLKRPDKYMIRYE